MRRRLLPIAAVFAVVVSGAGSAFAVDGALKAQAKDPDSFKRSDAARALAALGTPEAARILAELLDDKNPYVRDHTVTACERVTDEDAVAVLAKLRSRRDELLRCNLAEALGRTKTETGREALVEMAARGSSDRVRACALDALWGFEGDPVAMVAAVAGADASDPYVRAAAAETIGRIGDAGAAGLLAKARADADEGVRVVAHRQLRYLDRDAALAALPELAASDGWRTRAVAVDNALWLQDAAALDVLVALVGDEVMRVSTSAVHGLMKLTDKDFGRDAELWKAWWTENRDGWKRPGKLGKGKERAKGTQATYYGLEVTSDRVVFVLDASGSMKDEMEDGDGGTRWDYARKQLEEALASVPDGTLVNAIVFQHEAKAAFKRPKPLGKKTRRDVASFLTSISPGEAGNLLAAMQLALDQDDADTIFLLSDGAPSCGDIVDKRRVRAAIRQRNRMEMNVIHAVGFGAKKTTERNFMDGLARDSGGGCVFR